MRGRRLPTAWIGLVLALLVIGILQIVTSLSPSPPALLDPNSTRPNGGLALNLWLRRIGYNVQITRDPSLPLPALQRQSALLLLEPQGNTAPPQLRSLHAWVHAGGRLVIIADSAGAPSVLAAFGYSVFDEVPATIQVNQPLLVAPATGHLWGAPTSVIATNNRGVEVARTRFGPVVVRDAVGKGVVWVVSAINLVSNRGIAAADDRRLVLNLAGSRGSRVILDEVTLPASVGQSTSSNWLTSTQWGVVVLFGIFTLLLFRGLSGRRLGPPVRSNAITFRPSVEYVISMAGLLRRGGKRTEALRPFQQDLRRRLLDRYGSLESNPGAGELLATDPNMSEQELIRQAAAIVEYEEKLRRYHG